jgi:hypothetical protein
MRRLIMYLMHGVSLVHLTVQIMAIIVVVAVFIKILEDSLHYMMSLI